MAIKAISVTGASVIKNDTDLLVRCCTLLVLWAALHMQYTSRYCLGCEIYYILFCEWSS